MSPSPPLESLPRLTMMAGHTNLPNIQFCEELKYQMLQLQLISNCMLGWLLVIICNLFSHCAHLDLKSLASAKLGY